MSLVTERIKKFEEEQPQNCQQQRNLGALKSPSLADIQKDYTDVLAALGLNHSDELYCMFVRGYSHGRYYAQHDCADAMMHQVAKDPNLSRMISHQRRPDTPRGLLSIFGL